MILLHHPEVELSRNMLANLPQGCACVDWTCAAAREDYAALGGPAPSAFPTVVVDVPAYAEDRPLFGADGEFLGLAAVTVPAHQETLRLPASWDAVASFLDSVQDRARLRPAV